MSNKIIIKSIEPPEMVADFNLGIHWARVFVDLDDERQIKIDFGWYDNDLTDFFKVNSYRDITKEQKDKFIETCLTEELEENPDFYSKDRLVFPFVVGNDIKKHIKLQRFLETIQF